MDLLVTILDIRKFAQSNSGEHSNKIIIPELMADGRSIMNKKYN